ncbi:DoxX family protein [Porphyromonas crevioricanis]|uniref:DoxX n=2 Tax=Porphyromonas crevioricanis TaxID=393921 RepID=A0A0A2FUY1_9PORP|nr:DoxX family protein [Porphyromonas crevioricanis]KGN90778.1 DoxX family protein [Porphyromonas crevioricanis]KGN93977.1 DoxX family protein [Porphyromonas crevioricanis]SJZ63227.1 putative oxidoreductase [Porphyromonas crevioricanis]SQH72882.1 DoxX [Porphyromonas crevioricanis]GAD05744.1 DoxX family protein [Porphyromonas crevioricanis JCM 15906]
MNKNKDLGSLVTRLSVGIMMLLHGFAKIIEGIEPIQNMVIAKGLPSSISLGVYMGEVIAPLLLIVGYRTRLAALILVLNCIAIMWIGDYSILSLNKFGGWIAELPGLFLFGALSLFFMGGGKYALSNNNKWD